MPIATDIAFALAVLAVLTTHLPTALRTFLLTLAVVDDLLAITVIAVFYTDHLLWARSALALIPGRPVRGSRCSAGFGTGGCCCRWPWSTWALVHASGVHATVAGVVLGFHGSGAGQARPRRRRAVRAQRAAGVGGLRGAGVRLLRRRCDGRWLVAVFGHALTTRSPSASSPGSSSASRLGVLMTAFLLARFTRAKLDDDLAWRDVFGAALLAGIGFTVSLLIGELAFGYGTVTGADAKIGVLVGSVVAGLLAAGRAGQPKRCLSARSRTARPPTPTATVCPTSTTLDGPSRGPVGKLGQCFLRSAVPQICSTCPSPR